MPWILYLTLPLGIIMRWGFVFPAKEHGARQCPHPMRMRRLLRATAGRPAALCGFARPQASNCTPIFSGFRDPPKHAEQACCRIYIICSLLCCVSGTSNSYTQFLFMKAIYYLITYNLGHTCSTLY